MLSLSTLVVRIDEAAVVVTSFSDGETRRKQHCSWQESISDDLVASTQTLCG